MNVSIMGRRYDLFGNTHTLTPLD